MFIEENSLQWLCHCIRVVVLCLYSFECVLVLRDLSMYGVSVLVVVCVVYGTVHVYGTEVPLFSVFQS